MILMDGILVIDKPAGPTSHDVVSKVRRILRTKKVGHTGTLDPFATGVLVVLVGKATRLAQFLDKDVKTYEAVIQFGAETDTGDKTGTPTVESEMEDEELVAFVETVDWEAVLAKFRGAMMQTPPMYSAKKVDGRKMYELARRGEEIERKPVLVTIHDLEVLQDRSGIPLSALRIRVDCSAGTYIRTLAEDIGRHVDVGAHLIALRRTRAGSFDISQSITPDELESLDDPTVKLLPVDAAVAHLPAIDLARDRIEKTRNGLSTRVDRSDLTSGDFVRMIASGTGLIAVGVFDGAEGSVRPKVVLI